MTRQNKGAWFAEARGRVMGMVATCNNLGALRGGLSPHLVNLTP